MTLDEARARRVRELFARTHALAPSERDAALCASGVDPIEAEEVRELLTFDSPEPAPRAQRLPEIDGYDVITEIGDGTSGRVFSAVRLADGHPVAIKVLRHGADEEASQRFAQESAILTSLDHPGIARFLGATEAQTSLGAAPCIVLELVEGLTITKHADVHDLSDHARIELVAEVCDAVQHAHEQGVVHRDLKPANVLVDDRGRPSVLDFGIARTSGADRFATLARTRDGDLIGTLAYMSPEQARGASVDAQSDVYSIGVLLFELLTGAHPHPLTGSTVTDAIRRITHDEAQSLADARPDQAGDLATIVGQSLERDAADRYASAADLAADLRRYLASEAIHARPPGSLEQLARFARRNRGFVGACAAVLLALGLGVAGLGYGIVRARTGEARAQRSAAVSQQVLDELLAFVRAPGAEAAGYDVRVVDELEAFSARTMDAADLPDEVALLLHSALGDTFADLGDAVRSARHYRCAVALARAAPASDAALADLLLDSSDELRRLGDLNGARASASEARDLRAQAFGTESIETSVAECRVAFFEAEASEFDAAEERARRSLRLLEERMEGAAIEVQRARNTLAAVFVRRRQTQDAIDLLQETRAALAEHPSPPLRLVAYVRNNLAAALRDAGRDEEAEGIYREELAATIARHGPGHPRVGQIERGLGITLNHLGRFDEARGILEAAASSTEAHRGPRHRDTLGVKEALAQTLFQLGHRAEAVALQTDIVAIWSEQAETPDDAAMTAYNTLASFYHDQGDVEQAFPWTEKAAEIGRALHGPGSRKSLLLDANVAQCLLRLGRGTESEALQRDVVAGYERLTGVPHHELVIAHGNLGRILVASGQIKKGAELIELQLQESVDEFRAGHRILVWLRGNFADALRQLGHFDEARAAAALYRAEIEQAPGDQSSTFDRLLRLEAAIASEHTAAELPPLENS